MASVCRRFKQNKYILLIQNGGSKIADVKIKKILVNVTKLNFFPAYIIKMSF